VRLDDDAATSGARPDGPRPAPLGRRAAWLVALVALGLALAAPAASAHPYLIQSAPGDGVVLEGPPRELALSFSEEVSATGSSIRVVGARGRRVRVGTVTKRGDATLVARLRGRLAPAVYRVRWAVLGDDGHVVSGVVRFGVAEADGAPPLGVEQLGAPGVAEEQDAGGDPVPEVVARWLGLAAGGLLLAGALLRRRVRAGADPRWARLSRLALAVLAVATAYAVVAAAAAGAGISLDVLLVQPAGLLALVRLAALAALGGLALRLRARADAAADAALAALGAAALATYALAGHVQTVEDDRALALAAQLGHVAGAGLWMGGLLALAAGTPREARALRTFLPLAAGSLALLGAAGVAIAIREVDHSYFLRWSDHGRVIVAKSALLLVLAPLALAVALGARRGVVRRRVLRAEAAGALAIVLLASALAGLAPGRVQLLPAERGNLLTGASFATVASGERTLALALAPAFPGANVVAVTPSERPDASPVAAPRSVAVALRCDCSSRVVRATLRRGRGATWSARVDLPARGTWNATVAVDGRAPVAPSPLAVGDAPARGPEPRTAVMTADLSGPAALRCRSHAQGAVLAVGRVDALGGLGGEGRKLHLRVEDDGGDPRRAARLVRAARADGAIALLAPCGTGAAGALDAAGGMPAIVADPAAPPRGGPRTWRSAGSPRAEGIAIARYLLAQGRGAGGPAGARTFAALTAPTGTPADAASAERLAGLEAELEGAGMRLARVPARSAADPGALLRTLDPRRHAALVVDGDPPTLARWLAAAGDRSLAEGFSPTAVVAASPLLDERFQLAAGTFGRSGAISSPSEVVPASLDARRYADDLRALFLPDRPSISGLRAYVAGLALAEGLRGGSGPEAIARRLARPRPFTDALVAPWRSDAPADGAPVFTFLAPRFLTSNLLPRGLGGEQHVGTFFEDGAWTQTTGELHGPAELLR
jgi:methionine-rich copper-binding protein CopC/putative copper export protein